MASALATAATVAEAAAPPRRRPRGRTTLLIAAAALLGIVGGTAVGYRIQAERPPTPLPPLDQPGLAYPAKPLPKGKEPAPLTAAEDRRVKTDGDLRKLLLPKPKGARDNEFSVTRDWQGLESYALDFEDEEYMFERLAEGGVRRVAATGWTEGEYNDTYINLVQFRSSYDHGAREHAEDQQRYMPDKDNEAAAGNEGDPLKGSGNGRYYLYPVERKPGYEPSYRARAIFYRGDVMVDIHMFDTRPISKAAIRTLAERQLERL